MTQGTDIPHCVMSMMKDMGGACHNGVVAAFMMLLGDGTTANKPGVFKASMLKYNGCVAGSYNIY
eukprot:36843-Eustigmatos_ZCMA.PRE.1